MAGQAPLPTTTNTALAIPNWTDIPAYKRDEDFGGNPDGVLAVSDPRKFRAHTTALSMDAVKGVTTILEGRRGVASYLSKTFNLEGTPETDIFALVTIILVHVMGRFRNMSEKNRNIIADQGNIPASLTSSQLVVEMEGKEIKMYTIAAAALFVKKSLQEAVKAYNAGSRWIGLWMQPITSDSTDLANHILHMIISKDVSDDLVEMLGNLTNNKGPYATQEGIERVQSQLQSDIKEIAKTQLWGRFICGLVMYGNEEMHVKDMKAYMKMLTGSKEQKTSSIMFMIAGMGNMLHGKYTDGFDQKNDVWKKIKTHYRQNTVPGLANG